MSVPGSAEWRNTEASRLIAFGRAAALPGGGFGWLDGHGQVDQAQPRPLYLSARMIHVFALAYLAGDASARPLADSGLVSLVSGYADEANGGWYASEDFAGRVTDTTKDNYAHAHTLLAASTAIAAGLTGAEAVFAATAAAINRHFWSDAEGRARESWDAGFTETEPYRGANSNMHSVEAYLAAGDATGDRVWRDRALSIATHLIDDHARQNAWRVPEHYDEHWRPRPDYNDDRRADQFRPYGTTPGHSFEWARLLLDLEAALSAPPPPVAPQGPATPRTPAASQAPAWLLEAATGLFDAAVADAENRDGHPGLLYTVDQAQQPVITARLHWVACEAVLAADALHRRTGEDRFATAATRWWADIDTYFIDRHDGGWRHELTPEMTPAAGTWSGKPDLYHAYQALLFPSLPLTPAAAVALAKP